MAKKKSPNSDLIAALKGEKALPYDSELMEAFAVASDREWQKLEALRKEAYRLAMPNVWGEHHRAMMVGDSEKVRILEIRADEQWAVVTGTPPLTSESNLDDVLAEIAKDGYEKSASGLRMWARKKAGNIADSFIPNVLQAAILRALDGKALKKQQLASEVCGGEGSRLYKNNRQGDLNELMDIGKVLNKARLGYYRPDSPPPSE